MQVVIFKVSGISFIKKNELRTFPQLLKNFQCALDRALITLFLITLCLIEINKLSVFNYPKKHLEESAWYFLNDVDTTLLLKGLAGGSVQAYRNYKQ